MENPKPNRPYKAVDSEVFHKQSDLEDFEKLLKEALQKQVDKGSQPA
jgi:hypothetical protein